MLSIQKSVMEATEASHASKFLRVNFSPSCVHLPPSSSDFIVGSEERKNWRRCDQFLFYSSFDWLSRRMRVSILRLLSSVHDILGDLWSNLSVSQKRIINQWKVTKSIVTRTIRVFFRSKHPLRTFVSKSSWFTALFTFCCNRSMPWNGFRHEERTHDFHGNPCRTGQIWPVPPHPWRYCIRFLPTQ